MEALRRSKAAAGTKSSREAASSAIAPTFGGWLITAPESARLLVAVGGRSGSNVPAVQPGPLLILPYGGLEGAQTQRGVTDAAPDNVATQLLDEGSVVE